ncbi:MAG: FecR domain-containing protein [Vogesella sp.]|nr:FecR domain-containing protein [Vogesella sp.]
MNTTPLTPATPAPDSIDYQAAQWLLRQQQGLSPQQHAALQQWLAAHPAHAQAWQQLHALDSLLGSASAAQRDALRQQLPPMLQALPPRRSRWPLAAAACLCCAIAGSLGWQQWQQQQPLYQATLVTAQGEQRDVTLPDGSLLSLDSATRVDVTLYRQQRDTRLLAGQAFFQVAPDKQRPFHVLADSRRVTVLGTRFSVRQVGRNYQVAVAEGKVRVRQYSNRHDADADRQPLQQATLQAGQQLASDSTRLSHITPVPPAAVAAWRSGRLLFDNTPLAEVIAEFNRYGPSQLQLQNPASGQLRLTGTFNAYQPAQFAHALPRVLPLAVTRQHGQWLIHAQSAAEPPQR